MGLVQLTHPFTKGEGEETNAGDGSVSEYSVYREVPITGVGLPSTGLAAYMREAKTHFLLRLSKLWNRMKATKFDLTVYMSNIKSQCTCHQH